MYARVRRLWTLACRDHTVLNAVRLFMPLVGVVFGSIGVKAPETCPRKSRHAPLTARRSLLSQNCRERAQNGCLR